MNMKKTLALGTLLIALFLSACGFALPASRVPAASDAPEKQGTPSVTAPSAQPEITAPPAAETPAPQTPGQDREASPALFTGVMGTEFLVPEGFLQLDESPSIGYQYTFWHPEQEVRIVVYEIAPGSIPEGAYETDCSIASRNPEVTYFHGYTDNGEQIFYSKESLTDRGLKTFWITYPTAGREFGDQITVEFEKNCRF